MIPDTETLSQVEAQIADIDRQIAALQVVRAQLLRQRNAMMPISTLPPELVVEILEVTRLSISEEEDSTDNPYSWVAATQFCAQWRNFALDHPQLWTSCSLKNLRWFQAFLERSKDSLLRISTHSPLDGPEYDKCLKLAAESMNRIQTLDIDPRMSAYIFVGLPAPRLETLKFSQPRIEDLYEPEEHPIPQEGTMQNVRDLWIDSCPRVLWNPILPPCLPSLTSLTLDSILPEVQLEVLQRCPALRCFTTCNIIPHDVWYDPKGLTPLVMPNLQFISVDAGFWPLAQRLILPVISRVALVLYGFNLERLFIMLEGFLGHLARTPSQITRPHHLSFVTVEGRFEVEVQDETNATLLSLLNHTYWISEPDAHKNFVERLLKTTTTFGIQICGFTTDARSAASRQFPLLKNCTTLSVLRVDCPETLSSLLLLPHARTHDLSHRSLGRGICDCEQCHSTRVTCFSGLKALTINLVDSGGTKDLLGLEENLIHWLEERQKAGLELETLSLWNYRLGQETLDRLSSCVRNLDLRVV
ncbi:hypothetical protein AX16_010173 [Volvariella volvacea WC 439]|nr:hypothetical protein AX16_010173 [Volvariella volvacea WC 439]